MSDYVLEISNPAGFVQIDSELKNFRVLAHGTVPGWSMENGGYGEIHFSLQEFPPIIMYRAEYGAAIVQLRLGLDYAYVSAAQPDAYVDLDYVVLVPMQDEPNNDDIYVLNVWSAESKLVFSSSERYLGIDALVYSAAPFPEPQGRSIPLPVPAFGQRYVSTSSEYVYGAQFGVRIMSETEIRVGALGTEGPSPIVHNPMVQVLTGYFQP